MKANSFEEIEISFEIITFYGKRLSTVKIFSIKILIIQYFLLAHNTIVRKKKI
jgi:hypothetical protein